MEGKSLDELLQAGRGKLASMPAGGAAPAAGGGGGGGGGGGAAAPAAEEKKEEESEDEVCSCPACAATSKIIQHDPALTIQSLFLKAACVNVCLFLHTRWPIG